MNIAELRERHPSMTYQAYDLDHQGDLIKLKYRFNIEPDINFTPEVTLPAGREIDPSVIRNFAFHLGMIEAISYWKVACPPELKVEAGQLSDEQVAWWHDLFINGLGEFFYQNNIDFTQANFLNIASNTPKVEADQVHESDTANGDLILVGGGKDSGVTLEVLKSASDRQGILILNPIRAAIENSKITGYPDPLVVSRTIDPKLLELNSQGYLNGHTPFSAYLAFLGTFVGVLHDYENVIVSNERGASEGNVMFHGINVNHQYSKSFQFERLFREYSKRFLSRDVQYFSFIRPLFDLQISRLFAQNDELHSSFRSCNVGQKTDSWCGECAKCAFVYMSIFPYLSVEESERIFGKDFFLSSRIGEHVKDLVGLGEHKPFECVGTEEESRLAIALSIRKYRDLEIPLPDLLQELEQKLDISDIKTVRAMGERVNGKWGEDNFLPKKYSHLLKQAISDLST